MTDLSNATGIPVPILLNCLYMLVGIAIGALWFGSHD